jgi:predicted transcriptional regulator
MAMAPNTKNQTLTLRISDELKERCHYFANLTGRSVSYVAATAVEEYLAWRIPQLEDLEKAIEDADNGKFASQKEVEAMMKKWGYERN